MLKNLLRYTEIADQLVINVFNSAESALPQAEHLFSHLLNAQHIWLSRINKIEPIYDRFEDHPKEKFSAFLKENMDGLKTVLQSRDMEELLPYKISTGDAFENTIGDILFHVVNHSTYHRAQIASLFKQGGITPPVTDYVFLKRQAEF